MAVAEVLEQFSMTDQSNTRYPQFYKPIITIVGGFGSGKTEVAVNLAKYLLISHQMSVTVVDLDLVNPYFRSRQAIHELEDLGIKVVAPKGGEFYADLPILLPEIKGLIERPAGFLVLDVGGDEQGTRALGSMVDAFSSDKYDMLMVLNSRRPQTASLDGCIKIMERIEQTSGLRFTGLISNSHMVDDTDEKVITEGYQLARDVAIKTGLQLAFVSAQSDILNEIDTARYDCPILPLSRSMLKPWERKKHPASGPGDK